MHVQPKGGEKLGVGRNLQGKVVSEPQTERAIPQVGQESTFRKLGRSGRWEGVQI